MSITISQMQLLHFTESVINKRSCIRRGICVDWCATECLTMDHFRLTPPDARESVDLAIVADG